MSLSPAPTNSLDNIGLLLKQCAEQEQESSNLNVELNSLIDSNARYAESIHRSETYIKENRKKRDDLKEQNKFLDEEIMNLEQVLKSDQQSRSKLTSTLQGTKSSILQGESQLNDRKNELNKLFAEEEERRKGD